MSILWRVYFFVKPLSKRRTGARGQARTPLIWSAALRVTIRKSPLLPEFGEVVQGLPAAGAAPLRRQSAIAPLPVLSVPCPRLAPPKFQRWGNRCLWIVSTFRHPNSALGKSLSVPRRALSRRRHFAGYVIRALVACSVEALLSRGAKLVRGLLFTALFRRGRGFARVQPWERPWKGHPERCRRMID